MGESFQDYSLIRDFEILNKAGYDSFSCLFSVHLKTIDHLIMKLSMFANCKFIESNF